MSSRDIALSAAGSASGPTYIEDVFSTYLYTGNNSVSGPTINNGIDLAGQGGMVWLKNRQSAQNNCIFDTARGISRYLFTNTVDASALYNTFGVTSFNSNGFNLGDNGFGENSLNELEVSWTFRKAPKFFDVVTWTGNGVNGRTISHNLGVAPGMVIVKRTSGTENWPVYHRSVSAGGAGNLYLNLTLGLAGAKITDADATTFTVIADTPVNEVGSTYVAYLFAHDTTTDGLIQCGSYTGNGSATGPTVTLGWEPQYVLIKRATGTISPLADNWFIADTMRGLSQTSYAYLQANTAYSEAETGGLVKINATGFSLATSDSSFNASGSNFIYMAIRRGPMRTPTDGTKVFSVSSTQTSGAYPSVGPNKGTDTCFDAFINTQRSTTGSGGQPLFADRLRGIGQSSTLLTGGATSSTPYVSSASTAAEVSTSPVYLLTGGYYINSSIDRSTMYGFKRAPGFFDVVCYTGTGVARTVNHNLGVVPELMIIKRRNGSGNNWAVYAANLSSPNNKALFLDTTAGVATYTGLWSTPTTSTFGFGSSYAGWGEVNNTGNTYVAYLFASCPGVSKVGSYTGTGATQTISCGFTGGARFVLIKRTDSTGDWYVWDTARGMVAGTDPSLLLNSTAAEVNANSIYTTTGGFQIVSTAAGINASGGTYIYLAIA